jgi:hypothetical protein
MRRSRLLLLSFLTPVVASAQTIVTSTGTAYQTDALAGFTTLGSDLTGLSVQALYAGGGTSSGIFADLGGGLFGVSNADFMLTINGAADTFTQPFALTNNSALNLVGLTLIGAPGNFVFDIDGAAELTAGSGFGRAFDFLAGDIAGTVATYTNVVNLTGFPPLGDIYERIIVDFAAGLGSGGSLTFVADVDEADTAAGAVITPTVPEPGTVVLLATGLLAVAGTAARRRRAS